jgi:5-oxoprolinase (ATP-hydrolysing) subunit A
MTSLDLNADLGEGLPGDEELLSIVSSASIACGGHAGDEISMRIALRSAKARGVRIGAHPGFADPEHFGRRRLALPPEELDAQIRGQVSRLIELAAEEEAEVSYVKLHGALANMAAEIPAVAMLAFAAVTGLQQGLGILAIDNSAQVEVADLLGFPFEREAYADRGYSANGLLLPRDAPGAVLHDPAAIAERAVRLARFGEIVAADGSVITTEARSLCIHGDTPEAVAIARAVREALGNAGIAIAAP